MARYIAMAVDECGDAIRVTDKEWEFPKPESEAMWCAFWAFEEQVIKELKEDEETWVAPEWSHLHLERAYSDMTRLEKVKFVAYW